MSKKTSGVVVSISDGSVILDKRGVNEEAVALAEWLMKAALAGEIVGIVACYSFADGSSGHQIGGNANTPAVIGSLFRSATKLAQE